MIKLLRAARVNKSYIEAVGLHRCNTCEDNTNRPGSHKTSLPYEYSFNACLGRDLLEVSDAAGARYTVLSMVDMGTTFQQLRVIREGKNATSSQVLKALWDRWIAWAGHPKQLVIDRGLHFRGVLYHGPFLPAVSEKMQGLGGVVAFHHESRMPDFITTAFAAHFLYFTMALSCAHCLGPQNF